MAGSLLLAQRPGGVGLRTCFSLSIFRFSNRFRACADIPIVPGSPPPPPPPVTPSSKAVRSSKLPAAFRFISTPLSLLLVLPSGERSLLQDDWAPGLDWDFWKTKEQTVVFHLQRMNKISNLTLISLLFSEVFFSNVSYWPEQTQVLTICSLPCMFPPFPTATQMFGHQGSELSQGVVALCLHDASWWYGPRGHVPSLHVYAMSLDLCIV